MNKINETKQKFTIDKVLEITDNNKWKYIWNYNERERFYTKIDEIEIKLRRNRIWFTFTTITSWNYRFEIYNSGTKLLTIKDNKNKTIRNKFLSLYKKHKDNLKRKETEETINNYQKLEELL